MAQDSKYGKIDIPGVPDDEPVFILRGKDLAAKMTIQDYAINAELRGASPEFVQAVNGVADCFGDWAKDNSDLMKTPD